MRRDSLHTTVDGDASLGARLLLERDEIAARRIAGFHELDGIEFLARIDVEKDGRGELKNVIRNAVEPDHPDYARLMGLPPKNPGSGSTGAPAAATPPRTTPPAPQRPAVPGKPAWAQ
mgnify:CR=1 FL=1